METYVAEEKMYDELTVYLLNENISAGDQISKNMLSSCTIKVPTQKSLCYISDCSSILGTYAKTDYIKGSVLTKDMFFEDSSLSERYRTLEISFISLPEAFSIDQPLEIRISFPNGEDYTVLTHQKVQYITYEEDIPISFSLTLSEEELLRLSSARVDCNSYDGTYLYAVIYEADFDNAAETDYPVNADVFSLMQWDPNIISLFTVDKEQQKRALLEEHLQTFIQWESTDAIELEENDTVSQ